MRQLPTGVQMATFIASQHNTKASTKRTYASALRSTARRIGLTTTPVLDLVASGLGVAANAEPLEQAEPITRQQAAFLHQQARIADRSGRLAAALYVAYKTASRWDDVLHLHRANFVEWTPNQVVIEWGDTKTNRRQRYRASAYTVLQEDNFPAMLQELRQVVVKLTAQQPLAPLTTAQLRTFMRQFPQTRELTAHSLKRGALNELAAHAAAGRFEPRLLALVAKHKDALHDFPSSTMRYISSKADMARMLGTQHATRWL